MLLRLMQYHSEVTGLVAPSTISLLREGVMLLDSTLSLEYL